MTKQLPLSGMSLPPPVPAIELVSNVILTAIAIVVGGIVIAAVPSAIAIPFGFVVAAGLVVAMVARRRGARSNREAERRVPAGHAQAAASRDVDHLRQRDSGEEADAVGWGALGLLSVAILALAVVVPAELGAALAAVGVVGLFVFRLGAPWVLPRPAAHRVDRPA